MVIPCLPSVVPIVYPVYSSEVKHENEAVKLSMKLEESCGLLFAITQQFFINAVVGDQ